MDEQSLVKNNISESDREWISKLRKLVENEVNIKE